MVKNLLNLFTSIANCFRMAVKMYLLIFDTKKKTFYTELKDAFKKRKKGGLSKSVINICKIQTYTGEDRKMLRNSDFLLFRFESRHSAFLFPD